jgi:hypothetical protein
MVQFFKQIKRKQKKVNHSFKSWEIDSNRPEKHPDYILPSIPSGKLFREKMIFDLPKWSHKYCVE